MHYISRLLLNVSIFLGAFSLIFFTILSYYISTYLLGLSSVLDENRTYTALGAFVITTLGVVITLASRMGFSEYLADKSRRIEYENKLNERELKKKN